MSLEGRKGLKPEIDRLISQGLLEPCMSPYNTPILPVKKPNGSYRLVHDLREINKRTIARFPVVANPYTLLSKLSPDNHWYSVIDLKDAFWACPLDEASRDYFAFEWEDPETGRKQQLRWTVLPQGFTESPNLFGQALEQILENYQTDAGVTLIQYVDDLLLAGKEEEEVRRESIRLLNFLGLKGLKVSRAKLQFVEEEVKYLGHYLRRGEKRIDPERVQAILSLPIPKNKRQIRQILGLTGYCRQWIENYSSKARFLYQKLTQDGLMKWTQEDTENLKELKESLVHAPVLSLPDLKRPFYLFVNIEGGVAFGVLTQEWADKKKPVAYLSKLLDPVSRGWPTCLQILAGCALLVEEAKKITFNSSLKVYSPHNIRSVMQQKVDKWISDARLLKYEGILLEAPNFTLETTAIQNPATFLFGSIEQEPLTHNCLITIEEQTKIRPDLEEEELDKGERLFVDGSSRVIEGKRQSGYAIIGGKGLQVVESGALDKSWSAQACELYAILRALKLLKGKEGTIYTNSKYGFGVVHTFGKLWEERGLINSQGKGLVHQQLIAGVLQALRGPKRIAVVHLKGHQTGTDLKTRGNNAADQEAKRAAAREMVLRENSGEQDRQRGWKHSPTICIALIQTALEKGEAPEHVQYVSDITVWGDTVGEVFEKGEKIIQIVLKAVFTIKKNKVKAPAREIQFMGLSRFVESCAFPCDLPPHLAREREAAVTHKNNFQWGPEQQQAFSQIKQEIIHAVALGPVRTGPDMKNILYSSAGSHIPPLLRPTQRSTKASSSDLTLRCERQDSLCSVATAVVLVT
ncbi:uncharacterized protein LOC135289061 [Passer domesticus]|uniref:uncharacterized protein LOC135289061 n=1 Tax=Passer domesticus TaxID=48849 RepID=UPI0030FE2F6E